MKRKKLLDTTFRLGGVALAFGYSLFIERFSFQINLYKIPVPNLPEKFNKFRIVHLTDLHYGFQMSESVIRLIIQKVNKLSKNIIVCTGDYIHKKNCIPHIDRVWPILSQLKAKDGVYTVLGNHDHWGSYKRSIFWLKKSGQNIRHMAKPIEKNGQRIWIGGSGDLWEDELGIDIAFQNVPEGECKILLAHNPDTADQNFLTRIDLMISGHTHGGQVKIPWIGTPHLPVVNKKYSNGFIKAEKCHIFISRGIGWTLMPIRINCPPEIAILELIPMKNRKNLI